jgi:hypothetical protein
MSHTKTPRVLFVLKLRQQSGGEHSILKHSGLFNSATFVKDMLIKNGYVTDLVQVVDNNQIHAEVTKYNPDIVIIEALWVVPEKFEVLKKLHPNVKWIVRLHSELPFLANEGVAFEWINKYIHQKNVYVSANSDFAQRDLQNYLRSSVHPSVSRKIIFLPNYYPVKKSTMHTHRSHNRTTINVGCFGAIRPMKNHLIQAAAAVEYAESKGLTCRFHINSGRVEGKGDTVLKNIRAFFHGLGGRHVLVEHGWLDRRDFLQVVKEMDIGLQVSMSETFNIVSADFVSENIPMVTSNEIDWMPRFFTAEPTDAKGIADAMGRALFYDKYFSWLNLQRRGLNKYVERTEQLWVDKLRRL